LVDLIADAALHHVLIVISACRRRNLPSGFVSNWPSLARLMAFPRRFMGRHHLGHKGQWEGLGFRRHVVRADMMKRRAAAGAEAHIPRSQRT